MKKFADAFVILSGALVLCAITIILYATAYLRSGHPPASGIVSLAVVIAISPLSIIASIIGLTVQQTALTIKSKAVYIMTGVNISFSVIILLIFVFKVILGKTI